MLLEWVQNGLSPPGSLASHRPPPLIPQPTIWARSHLPSKLICFILNSVAWPPFQSGSTALADGHFIICICRTSPSAHNPSFHHPPPTAAPFEFCLWNCLQFFSFIPSFPLRVANISHQITQLISLKRKTKLRQPFNVGETENRKSCGQSFTPEITKLVGICVEIADNWSRIKQVK